MTNENDQKGSLLTTFLIINIFIFIIFGIGWVLNQTIHGKVDQLNQNQVTHLTNGVDKLKTEIIKISLTN